MGPDAMILVFWMLRFKSAFSLSYFTFIKRLFSSSSLSAIRVVLSAYMRLLTFLPAILIPAYASSSPAFCMMYYSACKLNKQGDNIQPWHIPFLTWNQFVVPCPVLTVASWPAYKCPRRQERWFSIPISRIFHSLLWSTQSKALVVNEAEEDVFLEVSSFFYDLTDVGNLISGSSPFSKSNLNIWKLSVHVLLKPRLEILSITLLECEKSAIVW